MISPAFGNVLNLVEATVHHTVLNHGVFNYPHYNISDSNKSEILIYQWMNQTDKTHLDCSELKKLSWLPHKVKTIP